MKTCSLLFIIFTVGMSSQTIFATDKNIKKAPIKKCYEAKGTDKIHPSFENLQITIENGKMPEMKVELKYTNKNKSEELIYTCHQLDQGEVTTCRAADDSGRLKFSYLKDPEKIKLQLFYAVFGTPDDKDNVEYTSPDSINGTSIEFSKSQCK